MLNWVTAKDNSSSMTEALSLYKEAAGGAIGEALLEKANMPNFARWYKKGRTYTGKRLSKILETEIPGTENIRIMPKEKAQQLSHSLGHSPEALGIFALPGGGVATPLYLKANKKLQDVVAPPKGRRGQLLEKAARAPRDYTREYNQYHAKPERVRERLKRNQARRKLGLTKGDPREVDHKIPLKRGGSNARSNLRAVSLVENRKKFTKTAKAWERKSTTQGGESTYNVGFRPYGRADVPHPKNKGKKITLQFSREASDKNPRELVQLLDKDSGDVLSHTVLLNHGKGMKEVKAMFTSEKHRRQGLGREVIRYAMLKNPSDRFIAKPDPFADQKVSKEGLKKVYASYGFQQTTDPDYMMSLSVEERRKKFTKTATSKEAFDPRATLWLLKKKKKATSPFMRRLYSSLADDSAALTDATVDAFNPTPKTRLGKIFKGVKSSAESVGQGTNPAMAATQAKLRFVADSGIGEGIQQAGESVAKGGKLMAESSTSLPKKALGRLMQGSGKATQAAGFWTANAPDALPGVLPL